MKKIKFIVFIHFFTSFLLISQSDDSWKIFDDSNVARVDITIDKNKLDWIYKNVLSDSEHVARIRFKNNHFDETIDSIGFRLRGNTSRASAKKSFKVSFNSFIKGKMFHGIEKLNLNGEHNDPSIIRSKLSFDHLNNLKIASSRANHAEVYINGNYYGLYVNVEHIDEEFLKKNFKDNSGNLWKCLWPADLTFKGTDPNAYIKLVNNGAPVYELKTNESQMDFSKLVQLINILNNTPVASFPDSIENILDVSSVLKYFAMNILLGNWDDYWSNMNNYYLYHIPSENKIQIIPYDYDNTFGVSWANYDWTKVNPYNFPKITNGSRPLAEKLLAINSYKNLYTHFFEYFISKSIKFELWESRLDSMKNMLAPFAVPDTFRTKDYGFTMNDFYNSYSTSYANKHVKTGIKEFVNARLFSIKDQLKYEIANPILYKLNFTPKDPKPTDTIYVSVSAFSNIGIKDVSIILKRNGNTNEETIQMPFSPVYGTNNIDNEDRFIGKILPLGNNGTAMFSISVKDNENKIQKFPRSKEINISVQKIVTSEIVINEFLADNINSQTDPNGEHDDWIELYNKSNSSIELTGKYLTDSPSNLTKWRFTQPNLNINPKQLLVVWCDDSPTQIGIHAGFKLSKGGEYIAIVDTNGITILDSLSFGVQKTDTTFGRFPDGSTSWNFLKPTPGFSNISTKVKLETNPKNYILEQNFPNPFNPNTKIKYAIAKYCFVSLKIFDVLGREIKTLVNEKQNSGFYEINFDARNLNSGIYFYKLTTESFSEKKKMILVK